jgi:hypothetical protein
MTLLLQQVIENKTWVVDSNVFIVLQERVFFSCGVGSNSSADREEL